MKIAVLYASLIIAYHAKKRKKKEGEKEGGGRERERERGRGRKKRERIFCNLAVFLSYQLTTSYNI